MCGLRNFNAIFIASFIAYFYDVGVKNSLKLQLFQLFNFFLYGFVKILQTKSVIVSLNVCQQSEIQCLFSFLESREFVGI